MIRHRGLATVETAIVLGLLLLLVIGGLEFALQFHVRHTMANAAREGARHLAVSDGTPTEARTIALDLLDGINANFTVATDVEGTDVTVRVSVPVSQVSLGLIPHDEGDTIETFTTMRKETQ